ncbi:alpha/beta fold hydrolase [uncultured Desulfosarcina sp.]|uniref:alpha/beta fold hydrolase n=1 Tax=uncultured Desulfosarcina sp. TaxID=218289 RepID=UPI0029C707E8|nr:alpha/beta fold hydrolase [uncultured Desulfosarcina sp.]
MNRFAYRTTGLAIKTIAGLARARMNIHGEENIPKGPTIFVVNHFTRIETFLLPYHLHRLTGRPVWSLAAPELFVGRFGRYLEQLGAVSTQSPDRDRLMVKTLLTAEACWIVFPEGRMVKNKKIMEKGRYMISYAGGKHPPHTGAATLALRTEFYRQRIAEMVHANPEEAQRLGDRFELPSVDSISGQPTCIVPVNLTYYPLRARDNALSRLAGRVMEDLPDRVAEEIMTEGAMLLSGVDIDMRFGKPIEITACLSYQTIQRDIRSSSPIGFDDRIPSRKFMRREALKIMQRYMSAIYRMTTVNHDHLFAACLKKSPVSRINPENLKRRVFLAAKEGAVSGRVYFHNSFDKDQVHLLTDDRYHKFSEFVDFAMEKGVLASDGTVLIKNTARLATIFDFHRSRIDNPIAVMANEVEPMTRLQRRISRLCWQPGFWLKRKVARYLIRRELDAFNRDYETFSILETSRPRDVGRPFLIKGDRRRVGVVLAHGYMAAPAEVRGLADYLGKMGFWVYAPRMKGHGTAPEDLAGCTFQDWIDSMDTGYAIISNLCRRVIAGGFSTGAGLALDLARRIPEVAGVFAVSAPLRLQDMAARFVPAVDVWNRFMERFNLDEAKKAFVDNHPENPHINYFKNPISGVRELERLMSSLEPRLPQIKAPALVIQSREDPVVNPKGTEKIFKLLGSTDKQMVLFNFQRHGILLGEGSERVYRAIGDFLDHIRRQPRLAPAPVEEAPDTVPLPQTEETN